MLDIGGLGCIAAAEPDEIHTEGRCRRSEQRDDDEGDLEEVQEEAQDEDDQVGHDQYPEQFKTIITACPGALDKV